MHLHNLGLLVATILAAGFACWLLLPQDNDRWVRADGTVACNRDEDLADILFPSSLHERRANIAEAIRDQKCKFLFAEERVRLLELGGDGSRVLGQVENDGSTKWIESTALKNDKLFVLPWITNKRAGLAKNVSAEKKDAQGAALRRADQPASGPVVEAKQQEEWDFEAGLHKLRMEEASQPGGANDIPWSTVAVKDWLTIELPSAWNVNGAGFHELVATWAEKNGANRATVQDSFMASIVPPGSQGYTAHMNVRFYPDRKEAQAGALRLTSEDIASFDTHMREAMTKQSQFKIIRWYPTHTEKIDKNLVLVSEYVRGGGLGDQSDRENNVRMFRVIDGHRSFTITVSYDASAADILRPVTDRIARSFQVTK